MLPNFLTVGLRTLRRDPLFTAINLFGLAIGLAGCLLIILFIRYELSFDAWLPDADRIYQVQRIETTGSNVGKRYAQTAFVAATAMPPQFPEIEAATGLVGVAGIFRKGGELVDIDDVYGTDANFLNVLRLPLAAGNPSTALSEVGNLVLTESAARRLFGRTDVVGRTVTRVSSDGDMAVRVTGVLRDLPANSHLRIGALFRPNVSRPTGTEVFTKWNWVSGWVYARLRPGADVAAMNDRMPAVLRRIVPESERDDSARDGLGFTQALMTVRAINTASID
ncbi:MAG TPA: ABC transporter permease, partial [Allosphingosinicella sp.]|nr:ABC transporter permease [Allosphingosinicella sp.]